MPETGIVVDGADTLTRTLGELQRGLEDLTPVNDKAGALLLDRADPRTPRQDGSLASSGRSDAASGEAVVSYTEVYAGVIHNGWPDRNITAQPWLADTADESQTALTDVYVDHVEDLVGHVRGA